MASSLDNRPQNGKLIKPDRARQQPRTRCRHPPLVRRTGPHPGKAGAHDDHVWGLPALQAVRDQSGGGDGRMCTRAGHVAPDGGALVQGVGGDEMIFFWADVAVAIWPRIRCRLGLHKWKDVRRYDEYGYTAFVLGVPCKSHWRHLGERCTCCGRFIKDRTPWWLWVARVATFLIPMATLVALCEFSGMWWILWLIAGLALFFICVVVAVIA